MNVSLDPALFTYRQMLFVMGDRTLYLTLNNQIFVGRELAFKYQRRTDDRYVPRPYRRCLPYFQRRREI